MPTPEENMQSARTFAEEVFGNKNLKYATEPVHVWGLHSPSSQRP